MHSRQMKNYVSVSRPDYSTPSCILHLLIQSLNSNLLPSPNTSGFMHKYFIMIIFPEQLEAFLWAFQREHEPSFCNSAANHRQKRQLGGRCRNIVSSSRNLKRHKWRDNWNVRKRNHQWVYTEHEELLWSLKPSWNRHLCTCVWGLRWDVLLEHAPTINSSAVCSNVLLSCAVHKCISNALLWKCFGFF